MYTVGGLKKSRVFNGTTYYLLDTYRLKRDATQVSRELRAEGNAARIVKTKSGYAVYRKYNI